MRGVEVRMMGTIRKRGGGLSCRASRLHSIGRTADARVPEGDRCTARGILTSAPYSPRGDDA